MRATRIGRLLLGLSCVVALGACGAPTSPGSSPASSASSVPAPSSPSPTGSAPLHPSGVACPGPGDTPLRITLGQAKVTGLVRGTGTRVVILSHQSRGTPCDLAALGHALAGAGFRVVSWTAGIDTNQATLARLVARERRTGATYVALVGASAGGATSIGASAVVSPPLDAVVALSPSNQSEIFGDVVPSAAAYAGPLMVVAGEGDTSFAGIVPELERAHRGEEAMTVLPGVSEHGKSLVASPDSAVTRSVVKFLQR